MDVADVYNLQFTGLRNIFIQVILQILRSAAVRSEDRCITGGFFFAHGRNMVENHALQGHVIKNVTVAEPIKCFRECQVDCRCISFNYQQSGRRDNCQLNEENRYTNSSALKFSAGWDYHDLVIDYNVNVRQIENNIWARLDIKFSFECSTRYLMSERSERVRYGVEHDANTGSHIDTRRD